MAQQKKPNLNTVTTINRDGSRFFLHPSDVKGRFTQLRRLAALVLIGVYLLLPWIQINGYPAIFLDVIERRFHLFGFTLAAQDMWLLFFFVSGLAFFLFYITAFLGRIWCGWACPQTVFLEHVFRRIERWIEGDATKRKALDKAPWTPHKLLIRGSKQIIFLILSAGIAHIFLSYFISIPQLWQWITHSPLEHWKAFVFMVVSTGILYFNFAWFREQLCIVICPYGRFQSALVDDHSYNVAYDYNRGDPPGHMKDEKAGDCINCYRCVQVCPTGIDIRHGLQLECIGCAACIDACDEIMVKVKRPKGLIRYASDVELLGKKTMWIRARTVLYTILLVLGMSVAAFSFSTIDKAMVTVTRLSGSPYYVSDEYVRNQFQVRLINKSTDPLNFSVSAKAASQDVPLFITGMEGTITYQSMEEGNHTFVVQVPKDSFPGKFDLEISVTGNPDNVQLSRTVEFLGPDPKLLNP